MNEPIWILDDVVFAVHQMLLAEHGGSTGIRDETLLYSALARPKQRLVYEPESSIFELAASYSFGLAKNHPLIDGNKRTALTIGTFFLDVNGHSLDAPEAEAVIIFESLASGNTTEIELAEWFRTSSISNTQQRR